MTHTRPVMRILLFVCWVGALLLVADLPSYGQDTNASLSGTVSDPTGAAIPGAKLTLTNEATGFQSNFVSDATGDYSFRNLTPGKYDLSVSLTGFKTQEQKGIELALNQAARVDVHLAVGQTGETVSVEAGASLINYENPTLEGGVAPETLQSFPLTVNGAPRSSVAVAIMMPGVTTAGSGNAFNARVNGGLVTGDEAVVDGATAIEGFMNQSGMVSLQTDFGMSPDITSEVKVLTSNYDAQYGDSTSGQLIIQTKSGGEQFHGAGYEYLRNDMFNAIAYGAGPGARKPPDKENDYGANIGGPILLPKMHGPNSWAKGYFYFNWEGFKDHGGANPATLSIASLNARQGNFSAFTSQLWYPNDPVKYGADAGTPIAYQGVKNQIDPKYADPVAAGFMALLPKPTNGNETSNYLIPKSGQGSLTNSENVYFWRVDFNLGNRDHLYYTYWWQYAGVNTQSDLPVELSTANPANPENAPIQRLNWEHTFSNVMTNHLTLGYLNRNEGYYALNGKASLPRVPGVADATFNPQMNFQVYSQLGSSGVPNSSLDKTTRGTYALNEVLTRLMGRHTLKGGFEWRLAGTAIHVGSNQGGTFSFNNDTTGNTTTGDPGDAMASFYLGAAGNANVSFYNVKAEYPRQYAYAAHAGDSWRLMPKLTMDYSLRWDYIAPFKEKYDHLSFIDPLGPNPGAIGPNGQPLQGRLAFAGNKYGAASYGKDYPETPFKKGLGPRVGFAYTLDDKTVVRAGYGVYFGQAFYPGWDGGMSLEGFNKTVNISETTNGINKVPVIYLNTGLSPSQVGQTQHISSDFENGKSPAKYRPLDGNHRPYSQQWNLTVERQLPSNFFTALSYVGTKGTHLPSSLSPINILNPLNTAITSIGTDLTADYNTPTGPATFAARGVNIPYAGWQDQLNPANGAACSATIAQALVPYPQFCGVLQGQNEQHGSSKYNSFQARVERHQTNGLYLLGSFTLAKLYSDASETTQAGNDNYSGNQGNNGQFSPYALFPRAWAIAPDNVPITGQIAVVYDLPFGRDKAFLNSGGFSNVLVGGWQVSPLWRYEYGTPFSFYSSNCLTATNFGQFREGCVPGLKPGVPVQPHGRNGFNPARSTDYFNLNAFEPSSAFNSFLYTGTGKAVTNIYGPSYHSLDIGFTKNTRITERVNFRFSSNFFNAFNNHYFLASQGGNYGGQSVAFVTDVGTTSTTNPFGSWNHSVTPPRTIQFAGRIEF
jgi:Carboxypeptidase regulatory-like domain